MSEIQAFECEVCDQRYQLKCEHPIDRITISCSKCGEYSAWAFPVEEKNLPIDEEYGICRNCKGRFSLSQEHVRYNNSLYCTEDCLARFVVQRGFDAERVAEGMKHYPTDTDTTNG